MVVRGTLPQSPLKQSSPYGVTPSYLLSKNAKRPISSVPPDQEDSELYAAKLLAEDEDNGEPLLDQQRFNELKGKLRLDNAISLKGSDEEDETVPVDGDDDDQQQQLWQRQQQQQQEEEDEKIGSDDGGLLMRPSASLSQAPVRSDADRLTFLLAATPLKKLQLKEKEAKKARAAGDKWACLKLRQEVLALAKMLAGPYREEHNYPMQLPMAHYNLAQAYGELGCLAQTADHCARAMERMSETELWTDTGQAFKREVNILMGESLLQAKAPKPQVALQHFLAAVELKEDSRDEISDPGIKCLVSQCYALVGEAKLGEAKATQDAISRLLERLDTLNRKRDHLDKKSVDRAAVQQKIDDTETELREENKFMQRLLEEAAKNLDTAMTLMIDVIEVEERQLRSSHPKTYKQSKLLAALYRRNCNTCLKAAELEGMRGDTAAQLRLLKEIDSCQASYGFLPASLMARCLKEKGAVLLQRRQYEEALAAYDELLQLQTQQQPDGSARQALLQAETYKLQGNVHLAMKMFGRAEELYAQAVELFTQQLGPRNGLVLDLEHRLNELRAYTDDMNIHITHH